MNFEQWKLQRKLEQESEFNSYSSKVNSTANICFIFFGVSILILTIIFILYNF